MQSYLVFRKEDFLVQVFYFDPTFSHFRTHYVLIDNQKIAKKSKFVEKTTKNPPVPKLSTSLYRFDPHKYYQSIQNGLATQKPPKNFFAFARRPRPHSVVLSSPPAINQRIIDDKPARFFTAISRMCNEPGDFHEGPGGWGGTEPSQSSVKGAPLWTLIQVMENQTGSLSAAARFLAICSMDHKESFFTCSLCSADCARLSNLRSFPFLSFVLSRSGPRQV